MPHLVISGSAYRDLDRLYSFLESKSQSSAQEAMLLLRRAFAELEDHPKLGRPILDRPNLREWSARFGRGAYIVRYQHNAQFVRVLRVYHSREQRD